MNAPQEPHRAAAAGLLVVALIAAWAVVAQRPPSPRPSSAPPEEFSADRAFAQVERLATTPRPPGTAAHRAAREALVGELGRLGLAPDIQSTTVIRPWGEGSHLVARVHNVVARRPGSDSTGAVLLLAHYDTRPQTPGAGDDASGVATLLETLRALADEPLRNDIMVLLSDGEELGLLGARAFVAEHPWAADVSLVLNFEARGNRGPSIMFETGAESGGLVKLFGNAAPYPLANSLSYEVYKRLPNDTDFTVFKKAGIRGLNFAFIDGHPAYHSRLDTVERLSPASLQHHGSAALALTRRLGGADLARLDRGERVYFNPFGFTLITYPMARALPLATACAVLLLSALIFARARGGLAWSGVGGGLLVWLALLVGGAAGGALVWALVTRIGGSLLDTPHRLPYASAALGAVVALLAAALAAFAASWRRDRVSALELAAAAALGWTVLALVAAALVPGASFLFVWPAFGLALGVALAAAARGAGAALVLAVAALPTALLLAPSLPLFLVALTLRQAAVLGLLTALALGSLLPLARWAQPQGRSWLAWGLAAAAVVLGGWTLWGSVPDADQPGVEDLYYLDDTDTGVASWVAPGGAHAEWTAALVGDERIEVSAVLDADGELPGGPAPRSGLAPPRVRLVADRRTGGNRAIDVELISTRGAPVLRALAESSVPIRVTAIDGRQIEGATDVDRVEILFFAVPEEGFRVTLEVPGRWPVEAILLDQSYGLPEFDGVPPPRPPDLIPSTSWRTDSTYVKSTALF